MDKLLTVDEVAELFSIKRCTVYKYTSGKEIPFIKIGNRVLFDQDDLTRWLGSKKHWFPSEANHRN